jgi:hypothetical protein
MANKRSSVMKTTAASVNLGTQEPLPSRKGAIEEEELSSASIDCTKDSFNLFKV